MAGLNNLRGTGLDPMGAPGASRLTQAAARSGGAGGAGNPNDIRPEIERLMQIIGWPAQAATQGDELLQMLLERARQVPGQVQGAAQGGIQQLLQHLQPRPSVGNIELPAQAATDPRLRGM